MVLPIATAAELYRQNAGAVVPSGAQRLAINQEVGGVAPGSGRPDSLDPALDSFLSSVVDAAAQARDDVGRAESVSVDAAAGQANITDLVTAVSAAEASLQSIVTIRDRVLSAYQEIMRMPI